MDTHGRSIAKAVSYRFLGSAATALIVFVLTGNWRQSLSAGVLDSVIKVGLFYVHERLWLYVPLGRSKPPEYEI